MKLTEFLSLENIRPSLSAKDKAGVLKELVDQLAKSRAGMDADAVLRTLLEREKLGSTGTGSGVAIPHGKADSISELTACFGRSEAGIDFESMDGKPVHLFILLVAPSASIGTHLSALARISNLLCDEAFRDQLMQAPDAKAIWRVIESWDAKDSCGG